MTRTDRRLRHAALGVAFVALSCALACSGLSDRLVEKAEATRARIDREAEDVETRAERFAAFAEDSDNAFLRIYIDREGWGDRFDEAILNYVRRNYGILIGEATAERIKHEIGSAYPGSEVKETDVRGRNLAEGIPRSFVLNSNEILEALQEPLAGIVSAVKTALEQTPPELGADVAERGMVLTGGGALLQDMDRLLMEETGIPVIIAEDPMTCVARGGGRALEMVDEKGVDVYAVE